MEESFGAQYALQIALQTLRERCHQFQQRILVLEEENMNLRTKVNQDKDGMETSFVEIDSLKQQVAKLTDQKTQLSNNMQMVSAENRRLWARLSKLTQVNENLGSKLNKINDTLSQHNANVPQNPHAALIRSKTFTQDEPHIKFLHKNIADENDKISLELEDISLKLISSIAKEKSELEMQCSQMSEIQSDAAFINSYAFAYPVNEIDDTVPDEIDEQLTYLKNIKLALLQEKEMLKQNIDYLQMIKNQNNQINCTKRNSTVSVSIQTNERNTEEKAETDELEKLADWGTPDNSSYFGGKNYSNTSKAFVSNDSDRICPMCSKMFPSSYKFNDFQIHVESHFIADNDGISNFEVVP